MEVKQTATFLPIWLILFIERLSEKSKLGYLLLSISNTSIKSLLFSSLLIMGTLTILSEAFSGDSATLQSRMISSLYSVTPQLKTPSTLKSGLLALRSLGLIKGFKLCLFVLSFFSLS